MKSNIKTYLKALIIPFAVMIIGYILLVLVDCIPYSWIRVAVEESSGIIYMQGDYILNGPLEGWFMDNWTDADCISIVVNKSTNNPFYNALDGYQVSPKGSNIRGGCYCLSAALTGEETDFLDHSYLWNGFQIFLRLLLIRYNIASIRALIFIINILAMVLVCAKINKKKGSIWAFIPFFVAFSFYNFQMESLSLLFFCDFLIAQLGCMAIIDRKPDKIEEIYIFSLLGASVSFFSMLMLPMLTLAFPLIVSIDLYNEKSFIKTFINSFKNVIAWAFSYGLVMGTKLIISTILFNREKGVDNVSWYTGQGRFDFKFRLYRFYEMILRTFKYEAKVKYELIIALFIVLLLFIVLKRGRSLLANMKKAPCYFMVTMIPVVWCVVCTGHAEHGWTQWLNSIILFAVLQFFWTIIFDKKTDKDKSHKEE